MLDRTIPLPIKHLICFTLIASILVMPGCAGHEPNPVSVYQPGDKDRSCRSLEVELVKIDQDIKKKKSEAAGTFAWNVFMFAGGLFVIVPFFLMNLKGSAGAEKQALKARKSHLQNIAIDKDCDIAVH